MLSIRKEQMAVLAQYMLDKFAEAMVEHIRQSFPALYDERGEAGVREMIQYGIRRAQTYGIDVHQDICRFIDLMAVFGREFDKDPNLPWASRILNDPAIEDSATRMHQLYTEARRILEKS
jgi:hypothetical protein